MIKFEFHHDREFTESSKVDIFGIPTANPTNSGLPFSVLPSATPKSKPNFKKELVHKYLDAIVTETLNC